MISTHFFSARAPRNLRPWLVLAAVALVAFGAGVTPAGASGAFDDDDSSVHEADIEVIAARGITKGCNPPVNDQYCPDRALTRAEMATFLARALELGPSDSSPFVDDDDSVHEGAIGTLSTARITLGCNPPDNSRYCPDAPVTRGQMASFLARALQLGEGTRDVFLDDDSSVHESDIDRLSSSGITKGCNPPANDRFCPDRPVTRAEMASFLRRSFQSTDVVRPDRKVSGQFKGTIPSGETWVVSGDLELTGDMTVEGSLIGRGAFSVDGNGHELRVQHGGRLDLVGDAKTAWANWGEAVEGWRRGDRLYVAPMRDGEVEPATTTWSGSWSETRRPGVSGPVTLADGSIAQPEVVNTSQSIVFRDLSRIMFHHRAGRQLVSNVVVIDSGVEGERGFYPLHFHLNGNSTRGSILRDVVVLGGRNHAFVPHGSHGITLDGVAAVNTVDDAFWWDLPEGPGNQQWKHTANNSNDSDWIKPLALGVRASSRDTEIRLAGFLLGAGSGNRIVDAVAVGIDASVQCSGFHWPEPANNNAGGTVWDAERLTAHNSDCAGLFVWQNDGLLDPSHLHVVEDTRVFNTGYAGIDHGAYTNKYRWLGAVIGPGVGTGVISHALPEDNRGDVVFEDIVTDAPFRITKHRVPRGDPVVVKRLDAPAVIVDEMDGPDSVAGRYVFEDSGLSPADFDVRSVHPESTITIVEGGDIRHRLVNGVWE